MKKSNYLFLLLISVLFTGCFADDFEEGFFNFIEINGSRSEIVLGEVEDYGSSFGDGYSYNIDLYFFNYFDSDVVRNSDVEVYFEAFSPIEGRLASGIYELSNSGSEYTINQVVLSFPNDTIWIQDGFLEVFESDFDYYEMTFEGVDAFGNEVYIEFGGGVDYYFIQNRSSNMAKTKNAMKLRSAIKK